MTFVLASLVELAIIGYQAKKFDQKINRRLVEYDENMLDRSVIYSDVNSVISNNHSSEFPQTCCVSTVNLFSFLKAQNVDFFAKLLFPAFYSLFNVSFGRFIMINFFLDFLLVLLRS